jgi:hypothetical protein
MRITITALLCVCVVQGANAAELPLPPIVQPAPVLVQQPSRYLQQGLFFEFGARYWYSSGKLSKDLFTVGEAGLISSLTYNGLTGHAAELFGSAKQIDGLFVNWNAGLGKITAGRLTDQDFPPFFPGPFSSTISDQGDGSLGYATFDLGYNFVNSNTWTVGLFAGFNFFRESVNALGCVQSAGNPDVCVPGIQGAGLTITERADWWSARLGVAADWIPLPRFKLSGNVAWVPFTRLEAIDTHVLRPDLLGGIPESGHGSGVQVEGIASYAFTDSFNVGVGVRYWYLQAHGSVDFGAAIPDALPQPVSFKTDRFGVFLQGSYTFGVPGRYRNSQWPSCC